MRFRTLGCACVLALAGGGVEVAGVVEPAHGLTPSAAELGDMVDLLKREKIKVVLSEESFPDKLLGVLRQSVERRHAALQDTAGLNTEVFDSLVLLAAGSWEPAAISLGWRAVLDLQASMDEGRRRRLAYIGFPDDEAAELSALHTRNFM